MSCYQTPPQGIAGHPGLFSGHSIAAVPMGPARSAAAARPLPTPGLSHVTHGSAHRDATWSSGRFDGATYPILTSRTSCPRRSHVFLAFFFFGFRTTPAPPSSPLENSEMSDDCGIRTRGRLWPSLAGRFSPLKQHKSRSMTFKQNPGPDLNITQTPCKH